jgi:esterase/lipase superfamily enzyme
MHRSYHRWHSPAVGRDMELLVFGHGGARMLAFSTSQGRFYEWEERGLVGGALGEHLGRGWVQLFCVDSVDAESWYARHRHPADRARRHAAYDRYLTDEVLPFTRWVNGNPFLIAAGASFGAYHAVNFALRHPWDVGRVLGMSGLYDIRRFADGYYDETVYFHNPCDYVANEHDAHRLEALRRLDIILAVGRTDPALGSSECLSARLWEKGVGNALRVWDGFAHDWPAWAHMLRLYLGGHD